MIENFKYYFRQNSLAEFYNWSKHIVIELGIIWHSKIVADLLFITLIILLSTSYLNQMLIS